MAERIERVNKGEGTNANYSVTTFNNGQWSTIDTKRKVTTQRGKEPLVDVKSDASSKRLADGDYIIVRMENGEIRMAQKKPGVLSQHSDVSGQVKKVLWAGEGTFKDGKCISFNNRSGTYQTKEQDYAQSGLDGKFIPYIPD
jgi:hypothetical protein